MYGYNLLVRLIWFSLFLFIYHDFEGGRVLLFKIKIVDKTFSLLQYLKLVLTDSASFFLVTQMVAVAGTSSRPRSFKQVVLALISCSYPFSDSWK